VYEDNVARELVALAATQAGVVTRAQTVDCGLSGTRLHRLLAAGRWQRVHRGVYATFSGPLPRLSILWAGILRAGPDAMLSHETAAEVSGLAQRPSRSVHVTVPADRSPVPIEGVVIHRSTRASSSRHPTRLPPQTRVEDTVVDLTQTAVHIEDAISWLARAVGGRFTTAPRLAARLRERPKLRWRSLLCAALGDVEAGCHSLIELTYLRDVERPHGLPASQRQARRETSPHYDDVRYQRYTTRVELDGLAAHPEHDAESYPCHVAAQVASVLRLGGWRGSPRPCARPDCVIPPVPPPARRHGPVIMGDYPSESASNRPRSRKEAGRGGAGRARRG
jgi:hypothetical protein